MIIFPNPTMICTHSFIRGYSNIWEIEGSKGVKGLTSWRLGCEVLGTVDQGIIVPVLQKNPTSQSRLGGEGFQKGFSRVHGVAREFA